MPPDSFYGYQVRDPFSSELQYFKGNKDVTGMAADDGRIIFNPYSSLTDSQRQAVGQNEAARLFIRDNKYNFDFPVTPQQRLPFEVVGHAYAKPENEQALKSTILARIISGDPSAGQITPAQQEWAAKIKSLLEARGKP